MVIRIEILNEIEEIVKGDYTTYALGLTENPDMQRQKHRNPAMWYQWQAESQLDAKYIEMYFQNKGIWGFPTEGDEPTFVYLFHLEGASRRKWLSKAKSL